MSKKKRRSPQEEEISKVDNSIEKETNVDAEKIDTVQPQTEEATQQQLVDNRIARSEHIKGEARAEKLRKTSTKKEKLSF